MDRYKVKPEKVNGFIRIVDNTTGKLHNKQWKTIGACAIWLWDNQEKIEQQFDSIDEAVTDEDN